MVKMIEFSSDNIQELFEANGMKDFAALWQLDRDFVEPPNHRRNGWSGVTKLSLGQREFYLKRQEGQLRRSVRYPSAKPTYWYEKHCIDQLEKKGIATLNWAVWAVQDDKAILVTEALPGKSLLEIYQSGHSLNKGQWHQIGKALLKIYQKGIRHGSLYPAHIYYDEVSEQVRFLDLERSRPIFTQKAIYQDLRQLVKRSNFMSSQDIQSLLEPLRGYSKACKMIIQQYIEPNASLSGQLSQPK